MKGRSQKQRERGVIMTKMKKMDALTIAIEAIGESNSEAVEVLENMITQLEKRSLAPKKPTKRQVENVAVKEAIVTALKGAEAPMSAKAVGEALEITTQRASALLTQLKNEGVVVRTEEKGKALFAIAQ